MGLCYGEQTPLPIHYFDLGDPFLTYETNIGGLINCTLRGLNQPKDLNPVGGQDHAKALFVSGGGSVIKARKVLWGEDTELLSERLDAVLDDPTMY